MQNDNDAKQLIAERLHQATNVLITVKNNPSVDELSAALALTLMLNKLDKHATAVFSGAMPPAMSFLEPTKTFENTVDSLRDFIIALDKEKADRLRYKVEDNVVKIFITPYRSIINEKDLRFSQGDFNVEVIVALGVENREDLDRAITAHGRILHDATVVTINTRDERSELGVIDWKEPNSSSICEMLVGLADQLEPKMLDAQMSTALLTGIVASTDRFSNKKTTPRAMNIAAELMADGANQQLIANNLQDAQAKTTPQPSAGKIDQNAAVKAVTDTSQKIEKLEPPKPDDGSKGEMKVRHEKEEKPAGEPAKEAIPSEKEGTTAEETPTLSDALQKMSEKAPEVTANPEKPTVSTAATPPPSTPSMPKIETKKEPLITQIDGIHDERANERPSWQRLEPPSLGGTLNATTAEVEEEKRREAQDEEGHNNITLDHHGDATDIESAPTATAPTLQPLPQAPPAPTPAATMPALTSAAPATPPPATPAPSAVPPAPASPPAVVDAAADLEAARQAVNDALGEQPFDPAHQPLDSMGSQAIPTEPATPAPVPTPSPTASLNNPAAMPLASTVPSAPGPDSSAMPPLPDFSTLPPLPPAPGSAAPSAPNAPANTTPPPLPPTQQLPTSPAPGQIASNPNDPNQFKIPGQ
jgi:nanoRNase/pAp phosphatase (c-di-AMP/oligoRNAs hydrolase)